MKNAENNRVEFLTTQMEYNPRYRHIFQQKINNSKRRHEIITSKDEFLQQLDLVDNVLDKIEEQLSSHQEKDTWLCCDEFTAADISLTVLLERLNVLGLENHFWGNGKRCNVEQYYTKVQKRESYKKTMPNLKIHLTLISQGNKNLIATVVTSSFLMFGLFGGFLLIRKFIR